MSARTKIAFLAALVAVSLSTPAALASAPAPATAGDSAWTLAPVPGPDGSPIEFFNGPTLACPTATYCQLLTANSYLTTLSGRTATTISAPIESSDPHDISSLSDIACAVPGHCVATGASSQGPWDQPEGYRDELSGSTWTAEPGTSAFEQVACNAARCVEIGTADIGINVAHLDDRVTGGRWVSRAFVTPWQSTPGPGDRISLTGVTCPSAGRCFVLGNGQADFGSATRPMFFYRTGNAWKGVYEALPRGADVSQSTGVQQMSCPASRNCVGLGTYVDAASGQTRLFAERFRNGVLTAEVVSIPPAAAGQRVLDVSLDCASLSACAGVALWTTSDEKYDQRLLLRYDHGAWRYQHAASPAGAATGTQPLVADVSCASTSVCVAVGSYSVQTSSGIAVRPAVWTLANGQWTAKGLGTPTGITSFAKDSSLFTIECPSATRCTVGGHYGDTAVYGIANLTAA